MIIEKPIFIVGTGRCGSTIFHRVFARHPNVAWLSGFCNRIPGYPIVNRALLHLDRVLGLRALVRRFAPPTETTLYWEYLAPGFSNSTRDLGAQDLTAHVKARLIRELQHHSTKAKVRQVHKMTGWPRLGYLLKAFPDAYFIHIIRDGRAVACSFLNMKWWTGWRGPGNWQWGPLPRNYREEWEASDRSYIMLSAIQWKMLMDSFEKTREIIPSSQYLEIKYEDFTSDPAGVMSGVYQFCELEIPDGLDRFSKLGIENRNEKWIMQLTEVQQHLLTQTLNGHLRKYGYQIPQI
jgi:hypothetical protein